jgi:ring-1,2-phenylacetyl-CoA epoxidase subunit PaaD
MVAGATTDQVWHWLGEVPDPEFPVISVVDLGIVRAVAVDGGDCVVTITPTYSGCPAMTAIAADIERLLRARGLARVRVTQALSPAWTTDWMSPAGRQALQAYGIAPPAGRAVDMSGLDATHEPAVPCPRCGSARTRLLSRVGSTSCKALYRCFDCREPFDYFKPH